MIQACSFLYNGLIIFVKLKLYYVLHRLLWHLLSCGWATISLWREFCPSIDRNLGKDYEKLILALGLIDESLRLRTELIELNVLDIKYLFFILLYFLNAGCPDEDFEVRCCESQEFMHSRAKCEKELLRLRIHSDLKYNWVEMQCWVCE